MQNWLQRLQYRYGIYNSEIEPEHETDTYCGCPIHQFQAAKWARSGVQDMWSAAVIYPGARFRFFRLYAQRLADVTCSKGRKLTTVTSGTTVRCSPEIPTNFGSSPRMAPSPATGAPRCPAQSITLCGPLRPSLSTSRSTKRPKPRSTPRSRWSISGTATHWTTRSHA